MKTIKNDVQNIVRDMLHGFYFEHKDRVYYDSKHHIIYRKDLEDIQQNVVLLSGGEWPRTRAFRLRWRRNALHSG